MGPNNRPRSRRTTNPPAAGRLGAPPRLLPMLAIGLLAVGLIPSALAAAPRIGAAAPGAASTGQWAWGAFSNATYSLEELGAYADNLNLTNGNLSATDAYVAAVEQLHVELGSFVVVNASAPTPTTRWLQTAAVSVVNESGIVAVAGDLPAAGTYGPSSPVTLVNTTCYYAVRVLEISAYVVDANYTYVNGSLALTDEQVKLWTGVNTTIIAYDWPTYTANPNGTTTLRYATSAYVVLGWVGASFNATFRPALTLVAAPLFVGKSWNASSNVTVTGWAAYAAAAAASSSGTNRSTASEGVTSLNTTASVRFGFDVLGSQTVILPNGTQETGYTVAASENGASTGSYTLWDGLAVLPGTSPPSAGPARPATPLDRPMASVSPGPGTSLSVVGSAGFPLATATPSGATSAGLDTAPVSPTASESRIAAIGTPLAPAGARTPSTNRPPTGNVTVPTVPTTSTTPKSAPPAPSPPAATPPIATNPGPAAGSTPRSDPLPAVYLVAIVATIGIGFLALGLLRARHRP